jgi:hypothetical protein
LIMINAAVTVALFSPDVALKPQLR